MASHYNVSISFVSDFVEGEFGICLHSNKYNVELLEKDKSVRYYTYCVITKSVSCIVM